MKYRCRFFGLKKTSFFLLPAIFSTAAILSSCTNQAAGGGASGPPAGSALTPIYVDQGSAWTDATRRQYYVQDQGSRIMPLDWFLALKQDNGQAFVADSLTRYGYLPNPDAKVKGLPVGFTTNGDSVGMTCSACHTRQIEVDGEAYRIDGGPAITDFQSFAGDLDTIVGKTLQDQSTFENFAAAVLGSTAPADAKLRLRQDLQTWYKPYHTIMSKALPKDKPWGPARLDAVTMILNRVTGLDIGTSPDHIIESNIYLADTPVRYPFVWNAPIQDKTQWPGFAENGNDLLALSRNYGEVLGVFADFHPKKAPWRILRYDYLKNNSANFDGLKAVEDLVKKIGPPAWPWQTGKWAVNPDLVAKGQAIWESTTKTEAGGCAGCHRIRDGEQRLDKKTWATPLCNVGTDPKEFSLFKLTVDTGVLAGAKIPFMQKPLKAKGENAVRVLQLVGAGTLLQYAESPLVLDLEIKAQTDLSLLKQITQSADELAKSALMNPQTDLLKGAYGLPPAADSSTGNNICKEVFTDPEPAIAYESRVMKGIWAAAPYLHNGSVPTLAALLEPAANRPAEFKVGPAYDPAAVGLAVEQSKFDYELKTTGCDTPAAAASGNSRCGHEFGTKLSSEEKAALLEFLKVL